MIYFVAGERLLNGLNGTLKSFEGSFVIQCQLLFARFLQRRHRCIYKYSSLVFGESVGKLVLELLAALSQILKLGIETSEVFTSHQAPPFSSSAPISVRAEPLWLNSMTRFCPVP